jgi:Flp pilus assembly protein TadD
LAVLQYRKYVKMEATSEGYRELGEIYERMGKSELASQALRRSAQLAEQEAD